MQIYIIAVTCAVVISAVLMLLISNRLRLLNFETLFSITLASLISAITLPVIFYIVSADKNRAAESNTLLLTTATIAVYVMLAFILSLIISYILPRITTKLKKTESNISDSISAGTGTATGNYLEQIFENLAHDSNSETTNNAENVDEAENNLEKSVDSTENIDKMGIENKVQESENLTITECIEEAFRYKEQNDAESAILYYMYALDKNPDNELTFWVVLDICVMYKTLGQYELALDILNSYDDAFGNIMSASVREEIESNLNNIRT